MTKRKHCRSEAFDPAKFFIWLVGVSALIYLTVSAIVGNGKFADIFFLRCADFFMDFFNSIRDASQGSAVYTERKVIYPPLANLIFLLFSRFTPERYNNTRFEDRYEWPEYFSTMMLAVVFIAVFAVCFFFLIYSKLQNLPKTARFSFAFFALFSTPVLYMAERGNMILFCLIALLVYAFTYDSKSKIYREIGLISLAFAAALKLYPAIFGWMLIADKRYKDAARCVLYGVLLLLIPSFFFGGPACFAYVFGNIFSFSTTGTGSTVMIICNAIGISKGTASLINILAYLWVIVCGSAFAISAFISGERHRTLMLGFLAISCIPSLTSLYTWAFMIIPLTLICAQRAHTRADARAFIIMSLPFAFIPFRLSYHVTPSTVLVYLATAVLSVWAVVDTFTRLRALKKSYTE